MEQIPSVINDSTIYIDGLLYKGRVVEIEPPKLSIKTIDIEGGAFAQEVFGQVEKLEASFAMHDLDVGAVGLFGNTKGNNLSGSSARRLPGVSMGAADIFADGVFSHDMHSIIISAAAQQGQNYVPIRLKTEGWIKHIDMGSWKPGDKTDIKFTLAVSYFRYVRGSQDVLEIDPKRYVLKVMGNDLMANRKTAMGI